MQLLRPLAAASSKYFLGPYLEGKLPTLSLYSEGSLGELKTLVYGAPDGRVHVWAYALDLRDTQPGLDPGGLCVLYHLTNELAFRNVANLEQETAELFASLLDERAHFGKGVYCTQLYGAHGHVFCEQLQQFESTARNNRCRVSASRAGMG